MVNKVQKDVTKAIVILALAIVGILLINPPRTTCDAVLDSYKLAIKPLAKNFTQALGVCKAHTDLGGCVGLFEIIKRLQNAKDDVNLQCQRNLKDEPMTKQWMENSLEIFVRAAWGSRPPSSRLASRGWLEPAQLYSFCKLRGDYIDLWNQEAWGAFVNKILGDLPGASVLGRDESWARSLMSDSCRF